MPERDAGRDVRVLIAGGGTGGHLMPALHLARELEARGSIVMLVGGERGRDGQLLDRLWHAHRLLPAPILDRRRWWANVALPVRLGRAFVAARRVLQAFGPDVVVGTGGYVSVPVGLAARASGIPLVLQEQNRNPGVATRLLARWAESICVGFAEAASALPGRPVVVTGNPIAPPRAVPADFAERLDPDRPTLGIFGGSQGARGINETVLRLWGGRTGEVPNLVWQTGRLDEGRVRAAAAWPERVVIREFFSPMTAVYPLLDAIVCRAGAMTLAELAAWGIPAVLVPYPFATADHQTGNARALERAGAAVVVPEKELSAERLLAALADLLDDPGARETMARAARRLGRPEAAAAVADRVIAVATRPASEIP
ncbi:MAG: undecaprenyldiphospho-muramoylpentapeptide beta-N-acetylglucosaminyltransferase [Gemmatimonadota bacterium]